MLQYNIQKLKNAIIDFYNITHLLISLYDDQFNVIYSYPPALAPFCKEIRTAKRLFEKCLACDRYGLTTCRERKELLIYQCHMGLTEAVAPILEGNDVIGYLMLGQTRTESHTPRILECIAELPAAEAVDREVLIRALNEIPPMEHEVLSSATRIMEMCASFLCTQNIVRAQQNPLWYKVEHYVREHLASPTLSMYEICRHFSISRSTLYTMSKESFGMGISDYIRACRIEQAKKLLQKKTLPICEISRLCGFSAPNYFTKTFKQHVGVLPKEYVHQVFSDGTA
ncbi:MAG: PocR ligand-binding domain-containing protein [Clostridia bacterium]|nr:PocR ligand-binding domain-containing protein [Clostridia bacterium]